MHTMAVGKLILIAGLVLVFIGLLLTWAPGLLGWFGHLPGDIRIERGNGSFFFPVTSMIVVSIVLSILFNLFFRR